MPYPSHLPSHVFKADRTETAISHSRVSLVVNGKYLLFSIVTSLRWIKDLGNTPCWK